MIMVRYIIHSSIQLIFFAGAASLSLSSALSAGDQRRLFRSVRLAFIQPAAARSFGGNRGELDGLPALQDMKEEEGGKMGEDRSHTYTACSLHYTTTCSPQQTEQGTIGHGYCPAVHTILGLVVSTTNRAGYYRHGYCLARPSLLRTSKHASLYRGNSAE